MLIPIIIKLIVIGVILWLLNNKVKWIDGEIKTIINAVVIISVVIWLLCILLGVPNPLSKLGL